MCFIFVVGINFRILLIIFKFVCKIGIKLSFLLVIIFVVVLFIGVLILMFLSGRLWVILKVIKFVILFINLWKFFVFVFLLWIYVILCWINGWLNIYSFFMWIFFLDDIYVFVCFFILFMIVKKMLLIFKGKFGKIMIL